MEQPTVVSIDRWSLYRGALVSLRWPMHGAAYSGLCRQVVFLYKWPLRQASLYIYTMYTRVSTVQSGEDI